MDIKQLQRLYNAPGSNIKWAKHCLERIVALFLDILK